MEKIWFRLLCLWRQSSGRSLPSVAALSTIINSKLKYFDSRSRLLLVFIKVITCYKVMTCNIQKWSDPLHHKRVFIWYNGGSTVITTRPKKTIFIPAQTKSAKTRRWPKRWMMMGGKVGGWKMWVVGWLDGGMSVRWHKWRFRLWRQPGSFDICMCIMRGPLLGMCLYGEFSPSQMGKILQSSERQNNRQQNHRHRQVCASFCSLWERDIWTDGQKDRMAGRHPWHFPIRLLGAEIGYSDGHLIQI